MTSSDHPSMDKYRPQLRVVDLDTGQEVDRPDVAAAGLSAFEQAINAAGGQLTDDGVVLNLGAPQAEPIDPE